MNLIGTNKLVDYIALFPDARIPLLIFLKEFPYRSILSLSGAAMELDVSFYVNGYDCVISGQINYFLKTVNISELNTQREIIARSNRSKEQKTEDDENVLTKTVSVIIDVSPPPSLAKINQYEKSNEPNPQHLNPGVGNTESYQTYLYSENEYNQSLHRINAIFEAKPDTPEFEELLVLIPLIVHYEKSGLELDLKIFEHVKHRMDLLSITSGNLNQLIAEDELNSFLEGKLRLHHDVLAQLFSILAMNFSMYIQRIH